MVLKKGIILHIQPLLRLLDLPPFGLLLFPPALVLCLILVMVMVKVMVAPSMVTVVALAAAVMALLKTSRHRQVWLSRHPPAPLRFGTTKLLHPAVRHIYSLEECFELPRRRLFRRVDHLHLSSDRSIMKIELECRSINVFICY